MSEIKDDDSKPKYIPKATTITDKSLHLFPNVKHFFEILVANVDVVARHVGRSSQYQNDVEKKRYFRAHGTFMKYFILKHLSNLYKIEITDSRTEHILANPDDYIIGTCKTLRDSIKKEYEIYKDSKTKAVDIIRSIQIVSTSHLIINGYPIPKSMYTVNEDNLREVTRYLERLSYKSVDLRPDLTCNYFKANADLIFDNDVIYEIITSKNKPLTPNKEKVNLRKFYQPIIYAFGFYKKTGIKIEKFKIYNPLLGDEYSIKLDNIDFVLFEKVLKRDVEVFSRSQEILIDQMVMDLSLFSE